MKQPIASYYPAFVMTLFNLTSWQRKLIATSTATAILALAANISIPAYPVPFTLQSLVVLLIGAFLGRRLGGLALLQYLCIGAMGLPVFANGSSGIVALMSPSAGYLYGYVASAYLAGFAAEKGYDRKFLTGLVAFAIAHQVIFLFGVTYLMAYFQIDIVAAMKIGYIPFVGLDLTKFILAALIMCLLWRSRGKTQR